MFQNILKKIRTYSLHDNTYMKIHTGKIWKCKFPDCKYEAIDKRYLSNHRGVHRCSGHLNGRHEGCVPPRSKFFKFHVVFGRIWQNHMLVPTLGELATPPQRNPGSTTNMDKLPYCCRLWEMRFKFFEHRKRHKKWHQE